MLERVTKIKIFLCFCYSLTASLPKVFPETTPSLQRRSAIEDGSTCTWNNNNTVKVVSRYVLVEYRQGLRMIKTPLNAASPSLVQLVSANNQFEWGLLVNNVLMNLFSSWIHALVNWLFFSPSITAFAALTKSITCRIGQLVPKTPKVYLYSVKAQPSEFSVLIRIGNHMISSTIWNKEAWVNISKTNNLWSSKEFTNAYLFQTAREKARDYVLILHMIKYEIAYHNCAEAKRARQVQK